VGVRMNSELTVVLGTMLLKKSTKLLVGLGKYLHYGNNNIGIEITEKEQHKFFMTNDHHTISQIVGKHICTKV